MGTISNKTISDYLDEKGIGHSRIGYRYLMMGLRALLDGKVDRCNVSAVYDYVSLATNVSPGQVDRAIRGSIRKSNSPVTNKEFLLRTLDDLRLSEDANAGLLSFLMATDKRRL